MRHLHIQGPTASGKSSGAQALVDILSSYDDSAVVYAPGTFSDMWLATALADYRVVILDDIYGGPYSGKPGQVLNVLWAVGTVERPLRCELLVTIGEAPFKLPLDLLGRMLQIPTPPTLPPGVDDYDKTAPLPEPSWPEEAE